MLKFECKELGTNCSYVAGGNTLAEVKRSAMTHTQTVDKDLLANMSPDNEMDKTFTRMTH
jgi:predicted small metal-binding protein